MEEIKKKLEELFIKTGYTVTWRPSTEGGFVFGRVYPPAPIHETAEATPKHSSIWFLKAGKKVCNISAFPDFFPFLSSDSDRFRLAIALLKMNFDLPFGRISLFEVNDEKALLIALETMFFIRESVDENWADEIRERLESFKSLQHSVIQRIGEAV